jgi:hypothetical protein
MILQLILIILFLAIIGLNSWMITLIDDIKFVPSGTGDKQITKENIDKYKNILKGLFGVGIAICSIGVFSVGYMLYAGSNQLYAISMFVFVMVVSTIVNMISYTYFGKMKVDDPKQDSYSYMGMFLLFGTVSYLILTILILIGWNIISKMSSVSETKPLLINRRPPQFIPQYQVQQPPIQYQQPQPQIIQPQPQIVMQPQPQIVMQPQPQMVVQPQIQYQQPPPTQTIRI